MRWQTFSERLLAVLCAVTAGAQSSPPANAVWLGAMTTQSAAAALDSGLRSVRNALYNSHSGEAPLSDQSAGTNLSYPMSFQRLNRIPVELADLVAVGSVNKIRSYLSNDQTTLYTEFSLKVSQVVMNRSSKSVLAGDSVDVERPGGVLKLPSGKILTRASRFETMPRPKYSYAMLLKYIRSADAYTLVSGFELAGNQVYILESISGGEITASTKPQPPPASASPQLNAFGGTANDFLALLRDKAKGN